jgi:hypothetical protein
VRSLWLEPLEIEFAQLVSLLKDRWFARREALQQVDDVAIALTLHDRGHRVGFNLGPVRTEEFPRWNITAQPDLAGKVFLFVDVDYAYESLTVRDALKWETVRRALDYGRNMARDTT